MTVRSLALIPALLLSAGTLVQAGVGFNYVGDGESSTGRPFNFAVCATSPATIGTLTAEEFSGEGLGPGNSRFGRNRGNLQIQRYLPIGTLGSPGRSSSGGFTFNGRKPMGSSSSSGGGSNSSGGSSSGGSSSIANEVTSPNRPFNTGYCWCPGRPCGDDDDDGGTTPGDDDDDDNGGGGGDPDPSVVPEPGSFALWALMGAVLVGVTRRQTFGN